MGFRSELCACLVACAGATVFAGSASLVERTADELILHVNEAVDQGGNDIYLSYNFSDDVMDLREAVMAVNRDHFGTGTAGSADYGRRYVIDLRSVAGGVVWLDRYVRLSVPVTLDARGVTVESSARGVLVTDGAGVRVLGGEFRATNCPVDVQGGDALFDGAVFNAVAGGTSLNECVIVGGLHGMCPAVFTNCVFSGGLDGILVGAYGRAVLAGGNSFVGNRLFYNNGQIEVAGSLRVTECKGAINYADIRVTGQGVVCEGNRLSMGVLRNSYNGRLVFARGCEVLFQNNEATLSGGALYNEAGSRGILFEEGAVVTFRGNTATGTTRGTGGAIHNEGELVVEQGAVSFLGNSALHGGGAIYNSGTMRICGATFAGNASQGGDGAVQTSGDAEFRACTFAGNRIGAPAGATVMNGGRLAVKACSFFGNGGSADLRNGGASAESYVASSLLEGVDGGGSWVFAASMTNAASVGAYAGYLVTNEVSGGWTVTAPLNLRGPALGAGCLLDDVPVDQLGTAYTEPVSAGSRATPCTQTVVTFDAVGGVFANGAGRHACGMRVCYDAFPTVTRAGYVFAGWYQEVGDEATRICEGDTLASELPHELRAHWTRLEDGDPTAPEHVHDFVYSTDVSAGTLTESCACGHHVVCALELSAASLPWDGTPREPASIRLAGDAWLGEPPALDYSRNVQIGTATVTLRSGASSVSRTFEVSGPVAPVVSLELNGEPLELDANATEGTAFDAATFWTGADSWLTFRGADMRDISVSCGATALTRDVGFGFRLSRIAADERLAVTVSWRVACRRFTRGFFINTLSSRLPVLTVSGQAQSEGDFYLSFDNPRAAVRMANDGAIRYYRVGGTGEGPLDFAPVIVGYSTFFSYGTGASRIVLDANYRRVAETGSYPKVPAREDVPPMPGLEGCASYQESGPWAVCGWRVTAPGAELVTEAPLSDLANPSFRIVAEDAPGGCVLGRVLKAKDEPPRENASTVVTTTEDIVNPYDGLISFREAVDYAGEGAVISFDLGCTNAVELKSEVRIMKSLRAGLRIVGPATLSGCGLTRILLMGCGPGPVELRDLAFVDGRDRTGSSYPGMGGGMYIYRGDLTVSNCVFRGCCVQDSHQPQVMGGAVYVENGVDASFQDCVFEDNAALPGYMEEGMGGAVYWRPIAQVKMQGCRFRGNVAPKGPDVYPELPIALETSTGTRVQYGTFEHAFADARHGDAVVVVATNCADIASGVVFPPGVSYRDETDVPRIGWTRVVNAANRSLAGCVASNDYYVVERVRAPQSTKYGELTLKLNDRARPSAEAIDWDAGSDGVSVRPGNVKPFLWYALGWSDSPDGPFAYGMWRQADAEGGLPPFIAPRSGACGFYRLSVSTKKGGD